MIAFLLAVAALAAPAQASLREDARAVLLEQQFPRAVPLYAELTAASGERVLLGEYAYALWGAGMDGLAIAQLDRAARSGATDPAFLFYAGALLDAAGLKDAAAELERPAPAWLKGKGLGLKKLTPLVDPRPFDERFAAARRLLEDSRYYSAAYRLHQLSLSSADKPLVWAAYSLALEKIGAFKAAAKAAERDLALSPGLDESARTLLSDRRSELAKRAPTGGRRPNEGLKGRYLCFIGGNYTKFGAETTAAANLRAGKFLSDRFDASLYLGFLDRKTDDSRDGLRTGLALRYQRPLPTQRPLSATLAARVDFASAAAQDKTSTILSPGLSYFTEGGSFDFYVDVPVSGFLKDTTVYSLGYSAFFEGFSW